MSHNNQNFQNQQNFLFNQQDYHQQMYQPPQQQQWNNYGYQQQQFLPSTSQQSYNCYQQQPPPLPNYPPPPPTTNSNNFNVSQQQQKFQNRPVNPQQPIQQQRQNWRGKGGRGGFHRNNDRRFNDNTRNRSNISTNNDNGHFRNININNKPVPQDNQISQTNQVISNEAQILDDHDAAFMKQFQEWESGFEKWRNENKNHPDKVQYKKYEDQFLTVRDQLLARRSEMVRRKQMHTNSLKTPEQMKFESQWNAGDPNNSNDANYIIEPSVGSNILTVQVPPSNSFTLSDSAVAPLLFGTSSLGQQEKDFKSDSFDTFTTSFDDDSSSNHKIFQHSTSIPGLDVPEIVETSKDEDVSEIIDLDPTENTLSNIEETQLIHANFNPKNNLKITKIEEILEPPMRLNRPQRLFIIIRGAGGSGKSHLAKLIVKIELQYKNDRCKIIESRGRGFAAIFGECIDVASEGYIEFIMLLMEKTTIAQMTDIANEVNKRGNFHCYSIEIHQKFEVCIRHAGNNRSPVEIRTAISELENNPTPPRIKLLDPTWILKKSKSIVEEIPASSQPTTSSQSKSFENDYLKILREGNVLEIVKSQIAVATNPPPPTPKTYVSTLDPSSSTPNTYVTTLNPPTPNYHQPPPQRINQFNSFQPHIPVITEIPSIKPAELVDDYPSFQPSKSIQYYHKHLPTLEEQLLEFNVFRKIDYHHQTPPELRELLKHVDVDKIIEKRKAVAQRKKILEYLKSAERPEDTVSNPSYPKNWEIIKRERPPRKSKRKKLLTNKIKRMIMEKKIVAKTLLKVMHEHDKMDLEEISSDDNDMDCDETTTNLKTDTISSEDEFDKDNSFAAKIPDEYANISPKSTPNFNHFNHRNTIDIRDLLWPGKRIYRPPRILIILRGAAGSGKSHLVQLIKRKESELGRASDIRILSIDDYFYDDDDEDGGSRKIQSYLEEMLKHLKKTIADDLHSFIIIDAENCDTDYYMKFHQLGSSMGLAVYVIELYQKLDICIQQCSRNITSDQIKAQIELLNTKRIPSTHTLIIPTALYAEYNCFMNPKIIEIMNKKNEDIFPSDDYDVTIDNSDSLPVFNWHHNENISNIYKLLEGSTRYQRPRHIVILMRGPDTHGKIELASMIMQKEREMRNESIKFINFEEFFVNPLSMKFDIAPQRHFDENMKKLTRQLRDIARAKSFRFIIINIETGDFSHYSQVHELMSSYQYHCYTIELYKNAKQCAENDPYGRSPNQFDAIIDEFKLNPTPDKHDMVDALKFYYKNLSKNSEIKRKSDEIPVDPKSNTISMNIVRKYDAKRTFKNLHEEFETKFNTRYMVNGKFNPPHSCSPSKLPEFNWYNQEKIIDIRELFEVSKRPQKIVIFIRGAPGSGKSYLSNLIARKELENGGSRENLKVLSVDKFFENEKFREIENMKYEKYIEVNLNENAINDYMEKLSKELETIVNYDENNYSFIIVDGDFCELKYYERMWNIAVNECGYAGYVIELNQDDSICLFYNIHGWNKEFVLLKNQKMREIQSPDNHQLVDPEYLYEFKYVNNESGNIFTINNDIEISDESDEENEAGFYDVASKWDTVDVDKFERMDGTKNKVLHHLTMDDYLQMNEWTMRPSTSTGKKRVRWADIEEKKAQEREREIGFIVGQTDWNRIMKDTDGKSALEKTKYIEPRWKN